MPYDAVPYVSLPLKSYIQRISQTDVDKRERTQSKAIPSVISVRSANSDIYIW